MNIINEFRERRDKGNRLILGDSFLPFKRFYALDNGAYQAGAIPAKYKELMGLVGSAVLRCNDCILYHIDQCIKQGCSKEEIKEALNIALIIGGSIIIPHLRLAYEAISEITSEQGMAPGNSFMEEEKS